MRKKFMTPLLLTALLLCACTAGGTDMSALPVMTAVLSAGQDTEQSAGLYINELMPRNRATLADSDGNFPAWIELYNAAEQSVSLSELRLFAGKTELELPAQELEGGEYLLVMCPDADIEGKKLRLFDENEDEIDSIKLPDCENDVSLCREADGSLSCSSYPTPGYENTEQSYILLQTLREQPELCINEVAVFNRSYLPYDMSDYQDWVELKNNTDKTIRLEGWYLSDSEKDRERYMLPDKSIAPGKSLVIYCSSEGEAGFSLNSERDELYLTSPDGRLVDYISLHDVPIGGTVGRMGDSGGVYYFLKPTPRAENKDGAPLRSGAVTASVPEGVYEGIDKLTVELSASGEIFYTLDGSTPTSESTPYTGAISLEKTGILKAVSIEEGKLAGVPLEQSYIINEGHSLPVACLSVDSEAFFGKNGIYQNPQEDTEIPARISFFEDGNSFERYCGVRIHGATSRLAQSKKSYKLLFRDAYDGELDYDLFQNGVESFKSLVLRAAQESSFSTNMRDIIWHELAQQCEPALSTQDYKYCILYLNGDYWGIYAFREAHSAEHFANHYGYNAEQTEMWQGVWPSKSDFADIYRFAMNSDMSKDENYEKVVEHIDLDALTAWAIIESYSGNIDINSPNVRFYYTHEDEKLHIALVDLDLSLFTQGEFSLSLDTGYAYSKLICALMDNAQFRSMMCERLHEFLVGPLRAENVLAVTKSLAEQLEPEIERDGEKWGYNLGQWQREQIKYIYNFMENYPLSFAESARAPLQLSSAEYKEIFAELYEEK